MASRAWARNRVHPFPLRRASDGSAFQKCGKCGVTVAIALLDMHACECNLRRNKKKKKKKTTYTGDEFRECWKCGVLVDEAVFHTHTCQSDHVWCKPKNHGDDVSDSPRPTNLEGRDNGLNRQSKQLDASKKQSIDVQQLPRSAFRFFMENFEKTCGSDEWFEIDRTGFQKWKDMTPEERRPFEAQAEEVDRAYQKIIDKESKMVDRNVHSTGFGYDHMDEVSLPVGWRFPLAFDSYESSEQMWGWCR